MYADDVFGLIIVTHTRTRRGQRCLAFPLQSSTKWNASFFKASTSDSMSIRALTTPGLTSFVVLSSRKNVNTSAGCPDGVYRAWLSRTRTPTTTTISSSNINSCHREARRGGVEGASPTCSLMRRVQRSARGAQVRIGLHIATPRRTHSLSLSPTPRQRRRRLRLLPPLLTPLLSHPPRSSKLRRTHTRSRRACHPARLPARTRIIMLRWS